VQDLMRADLAEFPNNKAVTGPAIRSYLRGEWGVEGTGPAAFGGLNGLDLGALAFQAIQLVNRWETFPTLDQHKPWVFVRYWQSGWVYGQFDGLHPNWLKVIHKGMPESTVNILIRTSPEVAFERRLARDGRARPERYEGKLEFLTSVSELYDELWSNQDAVEWVVVDGDQDLEMVKADVRRILDDRALVVD